MTRRFSFGQQIFEVAGDAGLFWPEQRALLVADLHLEKASAYAASGQMLPPYDSLATLEALTALATAHDAQAIICLGDNFHDDDGEARLEGHVGEFLRHLTGRFNWTWITGNHDPHLAARWGGVKLAEIAIGGVKLRHEAKPSDPNPEISGHFHPKYRASMRQRMVSRRCFVQTARKIIMPAFGALTGGMDAGDVAIRNACGLGAGELMTALVPVNGGVTRFEV
ncbi:MAG: ligase-associated DNA damage response endonuclease PdeM [Sphingorhabdus sp.]